MLENHSENTENRQTAHFHIVTGSTHYCETEELRRLAFSLGGSRVKLHEIL